MVNQFYHFFFMVKSQSLVCSGDNLGNFIRKPPVFKDFFKDRGRLLSLKM